MVKLYTQVLDIEAYVMTNFFDIKGVIKQSTEGLNGNTLKTVGFTKLQDILSAKKADLQKAYGIGPVKSRGIYNVAFNATIEYISG